MSCRYYARHADPSGMLQPTTENQCALLSSESLSRACLMDTAGQEVRFELCELNGSAAAAEKAHYTTADPNTPVVFREAPRTHRQAAAAELDEKLVELLRIAVKDGDPEDGYTPVLKHHQLAGAEIHFREASTGTRADRHEVERILIYAWGPSADKLAKTLGIAPGDLTHTMEAPELLPSASPRDQLIEIEPEQGK